MQVPSLSGHLITQNNKNSKNKHLSMYTYRLKETDSYMKYKLLINDLPVVELQISHCLSWQLTAQKKSF